MKVAACRLVPLSKLRLPGGFRTRLREPRVEELRTHIKERDMWVPLLVRKEDGRVLDGLDRIAALLLLKRKEAWCVILECTDAEATEIENEVNVRRRQDPTEKQKARVALVDTIAAAEAEALLENPKAAETGGRPMTPRGLARKKAAKQLGIKPDTLRKIELRERQRKTPKDPNAPARPLRTIGMTLPETVRDQTNDLCKLFETAALRASQLKGVLTEIENKKLPFPPARLQRLRAEASELAAALHNAHPDSLCAYCKGIPQLQRNCTGCLGAGILTSNQVDGVPRALWDEQTPKVMVQGELKSVWDYIPQPTTEEPDPFGLEA